MQRTIATGAIVTGLLAAIGSPALADTSFLDHRGQTITLEQPPEKLVSIVRSTPVIYYAVDGTADHIAGINHDTLKTFNAGLYGEFAPELLELNTSVARDGFVPNVEAILALAPDLVVQWTHDEKLIEPLERVGLKVVGWQCCTNEDRLDYVRMSGYISGNIAQAQRILAQEFASKDAMIAKFGDIADGDRVSLLEVDKLEDQIRVVANNSRNDALSGVKNLAADGTGEWWRTIDVEQFLVWNPEIIVIPSYADGLLPGDFYENPLLAGVKAVQNKRVYKMPKFARTPDAPEIYLTTEWLARIGNPDAFDDAGSFRENVIDGYKVVYGADLDSSMVDRVLEVEANASSNGYDIVTN